MSKHKTLSEEAQVSNALRLALTGRADGLPLNIIIGLLGPEETARRINTCVKKLGYGKI